MSILVEIKNFTVKELACKCCGKLNYSHIFLICLQALRCVFGEPIIVTCGCRCKKHNSDPEVGGAPTSRHICEGQEASAVDVTVKNLQKLYTLACLSGMFNEVIWYKTKNFIHIGQDPNQKGNYHRIK